LVKFASGIRGSIVLRMDDEGCDMMFAVPGLNQLYICKGKYQWQNMDISNKMDAGSQLFLLKIECQDTHIYMETKCLQAKWDAAQHYLGKERIEFC